MSNIVVVTKVSRADLKSRLGVDENFGNITGGLVAGWAGTIAGWIFKNAPAGTTLLVLQTAVQLDAYLIANKLNYMIHNGYNYFVTTSTYEYVGYLPGSSYPSYKFVSETYSYSN